MKPKRDARSMAPKRLMSTSRHRGATHDNQTKQSIRHRIVCQQGKFDKRLSVTR